MVPPKTKPTAALIPPGDQARWWPLIEPELVAAANKDARASSRKASEVIVAQLHGIAEGGVRCWIICRPKLVEVYGAFLTTVQRGENVIAFAKASDATLRAYAGLIELTLEIEARNAGAESMALTVLECDRSCFPAFDVAEDHDQFLILTKPTPIASPVTVN